jgi:hypothetical protein
MTEAAQSCVYCHSEKGQVRTWLRMTGGYFVFPVGAFNAHQACWTQASRKELRITLALIVAAVACFSYILHHLQ